MIAFDQLKAVIINVPGSILHTGPVGTIYRKDHIEKMCREMIPNISFEFLTSVCTIESVLATPNFRAQARLHDSFLSPMVFAFYGLAEFPTVAQKMAVIDCVEKEVRNDWAAFVSSFELSIPETIPPTPLHDLLQGYVRTKIVRTACSQSHIAAYERICQQPCTVLYGLILEDDVVMLPGFEAQIGELIEVLNTFDPNWSILRLGYSKHPDRPVIPCIKMPCLSQAPNGAYGNTALIVNRSNGSDANVAKFLKDTFAEAIRTEKTVVANDVVLSAYPGTYYATKRLVGPPSEHNSIIAGKLMNYDKYCWDAEQIALLNQ